jgi:hypothetical protein
MMIEVGPPLRSAGGGVGERGRGGFGGCLITTSWTQIGRAVAWRPFFVRGINAARSRNPKRPAGG